MDALVSGEAGQALLIRGADMACISIDDLDEEHSCSEYSKIRSFQMLTDVRVIKSTTKEQVVWRLKEAWAADRGVRLVALYLDLGLNAELRLDALVAVDDLLGNEYAYSFVANWLSGQTHFLESIPKGEFPTKVSRLFSELNEYREYLIKLAEEWHKVPSNLFGNASLRDQVWREIVDSGILRSIAESLEKRVDVGLRQLDFLKAFQGLPESRNILNSWLKPLLPQDSRVLTPKNDSIQGRSEVDSRDQRARSGGGEIHALFRDIQQKKDRIKKLIQKNDISSARNYIRQLVNSQLQSGDPIFASKSLCDLAQEAKNCKNYSFQQELAIWATRLEPTDGWAHGVAADALLLNSDYVGAEQEFKLAAQYGEGDYALSGRARMHRAKGEFQRALELYDEILLRLLSVDEEVLNRCARAEILRDLERFEEALRFFEETREKHAEYPLPHLGVAATLKDLGRLDQAARTYSEIKRLFPAESVAYSGYADVLKEMGLLQDSLAAYEEVGMWFGSNEIVDCGRADILRRLERYDEAIAAFDSVIKDYPNEPSPWHGKAIAILGKRDSDSIVVAQNTLSEAKRRFPKDSWILNSWAEFLRKYVNAREGLKAYDEVLKKLPYDLIGWSGRAECLKELGHYKDAIEAYSRLLRAKPGNRRYKNSLAAVYVLKGQFELALSLLPEAKPESKADWVAEQIRGMVLLKSRKVAEAIKLFETAVKNTEYSDLRRVFQSSLAVARLKVNRYSDAITAISDVETPLANIIRLHAFEARGDLGRAKDSYDLTSSRCPHRLVNLRDELARRCGFLNGRPSRDTSWIFAEECRVTLLEAA